MKTRRIIAAIICAVMLIAAFAVGFSANADNTVAAVGAVKFSITAEGSTFTITRTADGSLPQQSVYVRTVDLTAFSGVHYTGITQTMTFNAGETSKTVTITEKTTSQITQVINRYQYGTTRMYRLDVLDTAGFLLATATRNITYSSSYSYQGAWIMEHNADNLVYLDWETYKGQYENDYYWPNDRHLDVTFPGTSGDTLISDMDGNGYTQAVFTVSTDALFARSGCAPREYFEAAGDKMYATIMFTGKEIDDGYQYIQVLTDNETTCDGIDSNGSVNTPSVSVYNACFELNGASGSVDSKYYSFFVPHRYNYANRTADIEAGITEYIEFCDSGKLHAQAYRNSTFKATNAGALVLSPTVNTISVRFNARGSGDDDWKVKDIKARLAIVDTVRPTVTGVGVSQGPNQKHNSVTVTVVFNEIVKTTGNVILHTTWGDLTAMPLNNQTYANAVPFVGEITAAAGTAFRITGYEGTITDLHGLTPSSISQSLSRTVGSTTTPSLSNGSYVLTCASDLYWYADQVANTRQMSAVLGNDINMFSSTASTFSPMCPAGFLGTFDGCGHKLMNLTVTQGSCTNVGFFQAIESIGTVSNLTLDSSCSISAPS